MTQNIVEFNLKFKNMKTGRKFTIKFPADENFNFQQMTDSAEKNGLIEILNTQTRRVVWRSDAT